LNTAGASLAAQDSSLLEIPVRDLRAGLFVAQLDRPWTGTPFLLQGVLLDDAAAEQMRTLCEKVYVDPRRSDALALQLTKGASANAAAVLSPAPARPLRPEDRKLVIYADEGQEPNLIDALKQDFQPGGTLARSFKGGAAELPALVAPDVNALFSSASRRWTRLRKFWHDLRNPQDAAPKPLPKSRNPKFVGTEEDLLRYPPAPPISKEALAEAQRNIGSVQAAVDRMYADVDLQSDLQLEDLEDSMAELVSTVLTDPNAAMWMTRMREHEPTAFGRGLKSAVFMMTFGRHIGYSREGLIKLGMIGMLLDMGKIKIDKDVLATPGPLNDAQWRQVQEHVRLGVELLESDRRLDSDVRLAILHHHERADGSGYPQGLADDKISTFGRMAAIVDTVAAMTSVRPYAAALSTYDALREIQRTSATRFNAAMMEQFIQAIGVFPIGSLVELSNGEVAAVTGHNPIRRLEPRVLVLTLPDKSAISAPFERDLLYRPSDAAGKTIYILRGLPIGAYGVDPRKYYLD
jgi:HD-GYP domain-containing protein (c-di-GMP phosphodiesterase class II)